MAPSKDVSSPATPRATMTELSGEDLRFLQEQLRTALHTLCESPVFRNSPKSCDFIRHVVHLTLEGRTDELKERLIGMSLLGRDASYDTSTDSGVRVRANDVRKRLIKYNETSGACLAFNIVLPTGTYIPRFFRAMEEASEEPLILHEQKEEALPVKILEAPPSRPFMQPLTSLQLAAPALVAIFVCIICMRWQLAQEQYFTNFWQEILHEDQTPLYLTPSQTEDKQELVALRELDEAAPLLDLAGQFHRRFTIMSPGSSAAQGSIALHVGLSASLALPSSPQIPARYSLIKNPQGRMIVDRRDSLRPLSGHAALLTIINGPQRAIYIDGTDDSAIRSLIARLCDASTFPRSLADSFLPGTIVQAVFPMENHARPILDKEPLTSAVARLEYLP